MCNTYCPFADPDCPGGDTDGDTISNGDEGSLIGRDTDLDTIPDYFDTDSDGDTLPDAEEAGDADLDTPPRDTDGDGLPDFIDPDSDDDGLSDELETTAGTDPTNPDTDADGVTDLIEVTAGTDPLDPADNPRARGDFVFVEGFGAAPDPAADTLDFTTDVVQADVVFLMDTTGSMGGELTELRTSLGHIVDTLSIDIPDIAFGVGSYRDFPYSPYGSTGDWPFRLVHRIMTAGTVDGRTSLQTAVSALVAGGGYDGPESSWEALHQVATGAGLTAGGYTIPCPSPPSRPCVIERVTSCVIAARRRPEDGARYRGFCAATT